MDSHAEQTVTKTRDSSKSLFVVSVFLLTAVIWYLTLLFLYTLPTVAAAIIVLTGWGVIKFLQGLSVEYEYEVIEEYLSIAKIISKSRRKDLISIDFTKVEKCNYTSSAEFNSKHGISKTYDYSGNPNASGRVFADFIPEGKSEKVRVIFCPNDKIKEILKKSAPHTVKL